VLRLEIMSIGDELLIGHTVNTNAAWMGEQLFQSGIQASWVSVVGDDAAAIQTALSMAESRADVILVTGGLGPTHDDITRTVVCDYFSTALALNADVLTHIKHLFSRRGIPMARVNENQAMVPQSARLITNHHGTAPGYVFLRPGKHFYFMPGVPFEMKAMMTDVILPELASLKQDQVIHHQILSTIGIAESALFERIGDIQAVEAFAKVAFLPAPSGIRIRLTVLDHDPAHAQERLRQAAKLIRRNIESYIYAEKDVPLEQVLADRLVQAGKTIAVAESCTGGLIAHKFTNIPGSSRFFERGVVSYSNAAKTEILGVSQELITTHGAVSGEVARAMAEGIRRISGTDFGLSTTGIAGPDGGSAEKPVGLIYIGLADANNSAVHERHTFANDRLVNKERFAYAALNLLRKKIQGIAD